METAERLEKCLAVYAMVAWRLLWLTYQQRIQPEQSCTVALQPHQWKALYSYIHKTNTIPDQEPTLHQAVVWIAQLGGFIGRKGDGQPGVKVLWRSWQRLEDIVQMWLIVHPPDMGNG